MSGGGKTVATILVVDDDRNILKLIRMKLESEGYQVKTAAELDSAVGLARETSLDLALIDLKLNGTDGIYLMEQLHQINPELAVIILTAYGTIDSAVEAMKRGARGYLTKPFDSHQLLSQVQNLLEAVRLDKEIRRLKIMLKDRYGFDNIIGKSDKMKRVLEQVALAAESEANVYIEGESGTGKELIAKALHIASSRKDGPFVAINCAAIPETLLESELFGFERGAFTGAAQSKKGLFAQADKGAFFMDEISEMPISMQAKVLRVIQERTFYPLGAEKSLRVDARLISSSNRNLSEEVERGNFREDLFYRIHVIVIKLPPLRERKEDIPLLAKHFLKKYGRSMAKAVTGFSPEAVQKMMQHPWPGNVRELENTVEGAVALATKEMISEDLILSNQVRNGGFESYKNAKENFERSYLRQLLEFTEGNVTQAAKLAGKYRADLYELLKKYSLTPEDFRKQ
jgi:two-component system response regulator GlrR